MDVKILLKNIFQIQISFFPHYFITAADLISKSVLVSYFTQSYDPWTRAMYLSQRCPLPVRGNPGGILRRGLRFGSERERVAYVARFVEGYLRQKDMMEK